MYIELPMISENIAPTAISLSQSAKIRIDELIAEEGNYNLKLRIYITGGGCSGFQYGFAFDEGNKPDDYLISSPLEDGHTVAVVVDALSMMYLRGAEVDYVENLQGAHFTVKNPNAQTTCSCGSSFAI
jgi:iron-sulfur cluster insertion protein